MNRIKSLENIKYIFFLPLAILIVYMASFIPNGIEILYSTGIYKLISQIISSVTGYIPVSMAEYIVIMLMLYLLWTIIKIIHKIITHSNNRIKIIIDYFKKFIILISITYFTFIMIWGLNYHRLPFAQIAGFEIRKASINELEDLCEDLIAKTNRLRHHIQEDPTGVMTLSKGPQDVFTRAAKGYGVASTVYPELGGNYGQPKGVLFSEVLSYLGISGIYFPFTYEANVNTLINDAILPATASHEMAHQRGFAREDEANYIAYVVCSLHPDKDFQYSGSLLALIHAMNTLARYDMARYTELSNLYSPGVRRDLVAINKFWNKYKGPIERTSSKINDAYLKSNLQEDGIYSYGRMVDLLLAERRSKAINN